MTANRFDSLFDTPRVDLSNLPSEALLPVQSRGGWSSVRAQSLLRFQGVPALGEVVKRPTGFNFNWSTYFPHRIWFDNTGKPQTDFNPYMYYPYSGNPLFYGWKILYLDNVAGNNANDGSTPALAKQSFSSIITAVNAASEPGCIIWVKNTGTDYIRTHAWNGATRLNKAVCVVGWNGRPLMGMHDNAGTWALDGTYTNCYSVNTFTTLSRVQNLLLRDKFGDPELFTEYASPALLDAAASPVYGFAVDGSKSYVRRGDGVAPSNTNTRCMRPSVEGVRGPTSGDCIIWDMIFEGGNNGSFIGDSNATGKVFLFNVHGRFAGRPSGATDAFKARDIAFMLCYRCTASHSPSDAFDYTPTSGTTPHGVLIDCVAYAHGEGTSQSNNAVTAHDGSILLVIGGVGEEVYGGTVAILDTNDTGTQAYLIGYCAKNSLGDEDLGGTIAPCNYQVLTNAEVWLDGCSSVKDDETLRDFSVSGGGILYYRNMQLQDNDLQAKSGTSATSGRASRILEY